MSAPKPARATYEDVLNAPDNLVAELIEGELYTSPRPAIRHANASSVLAGELNSAFQRARGGPGGWWILVEPELHLGEDVLVPDLAGWRRERLPTLPDAAAFELAPDWVCEVVSPATGRLDRVKKMPRYARAGTDHLWLVDPSTRILEVFRREGDRWLVVATHGGDEKVRVEPFEAIEIELLPVWGEERARDA